MSTVAPIAASASSSPAPFTDQYSDGLITLCDHNNRPVTSGSLQTVPFAWKAISSGTAPSGYKEAFLSVFQPLQHVDPADWSGYQLTGDSVFSNASHPVAQATYHDPPLEWPDHNYPPYWNGLYELRMFYSGVNLATQNQAYPTAIISVHGSNWSMVEGGGTSCNAGTAVSLETLRLPASETETPQSLIVNNKPYEPGAAHSSKGHTSTTTKASTPSTSTTSAASGQTSNIRPAAVAAGAGHSGSTPSSTGLAVLIGVLAAAVVAVAGWLVWRRRRMTSRIAGAAEDQ
jgi:hypothetical protein